jgi:hypothetical protein
MAIGRVGVRPYSGSTTTTTTALSYDGDAQAFITAAALTDTTQKTAVNDLVLDLKAAGIWTKMKALYPMVGGTATTHKFNLKDPRDLDAAYRLVFNGGGAHSSTGYQPNGTTAYANTFLVQSSALLQNDYSFSIYSRTNKTGNSGIITGVVQPAGYTYLYLKNSVNNMILNMNGLSEYAVSNTDSRGFYQSIRSSSTIIKLLKNNTINSSSITSTINHTIPFFLGARNQDGTASTYDICEISFSSYGYGLTDLESNLFYQIVEKYQYALGRNVNATQSFYYNSSYSNQTNAYLFESKISDITTLPVTSGLILSLDAGTTASYPGTGTNWYDLSLNSNTGELTNGPTFNSLNGGSIVFDGVNDFIDYGTSTNDIRTAGSLSVGMVFYCTSYSNQQGSYSWAPLIAMDQYQSGSSYRKFVLSLSNDNGSQAVAAWVGNGGTGAVQPYYNMNLLYSRIYAVFTVDSSYTRLYINGVLVSETTGIVANTTCPARLTIGTRIGTPYDGYFKGDIYNVVSYNRALTESEVLQNFNAIKNRYGLTKFKTGISTGVVLAYDAGNTLSYTGSGTTIYDISGNNYRGTLTNGPTFNSLNGGSIVFDGVDDFISTPNAFGYSNWTVSMWVKITAPMPTPYPYYGMHCLVEGDTITKFLAITDTSVSVYTTPIVSYSFVNNPGWHNISISYNGTQITAIIDGSVTGTITISNPLATSKVRRIGRRDATDNVHPFKGNISIVNFYSRVLTSTEVVDNFNSIKSRYGL